LRYEFTYTTTVNTPDGPQDVSTTFSVGGITDDVAKAIRFGLTKLSSIKNVSAERIDESRQQVTGTPT
jgi:hypothetical protein